jgi:hypothetical protein
MLRAVDDQRLRLELSLEIAKDAQLAATEFWKLWLWRAKEISAHPPSVLCVRLAERFHVSPDDVQKQWAEWYELLTSWDLAAALTGRDVRATTVAYGTSHRRT